MLLLAPFIALSAFFGFVTLAMGYFLRGFERLFGLVGAEPDFGSQFLINAGVKQLPTFNRGVLKR